MAAQCIEELYGAIEEFSVLLAAAELMAANKAGTLDSAIVCGTLKEKPAKLPPEINAVWIENGIAGGDQQLQQAS